MREKLKTPPGAFRYLSSVAGLTKLNIVAMALIRAVQSVLGVVSAFFLRDIVNCAVSGDRSAFVASIVRFISLIVFQLLLTVFTRWFRVHTQNSLSKRFTTRLFSTLMTKDYEHVSQIHSAEWMNRMNTDIRTAVNGVFGFIPGAVGTIVQLISAVGAIIVLEPRFLYIIIPAGIFVIIVSYLLREPSKALQRKVHDINVKLRIFMQEMLQNLLIVRSFGVEKDVTAETEEKFDDFNRARMKRNNFSNLINAGYSVIMNCIYILGVIFCGYGILTGTMTYGDFTAVLSLISQVSGPISSISGMVSEYYTLMVSVERLMEAENYPEGNDPDPYTLNEVKERYERDIEGIGLKNVSFRYLPPVKDVKTEMPLIIPNASLEIKKGEYVAFAGESGCGKSTLLKILMCLYPVDGGERYVMTEDGEEPLTGKWQKLFAYVPQGNYLMSGTIREVVAFSDKSLMGDDERIWRALETACADEFVKGLEEGLDTPLGERGSGLSEGQTQRIAIARAVFSDHPILMLDECTSGLDEDTEQRLLIRLKEMTDRTVIIVTHRKAALSICDKVVRFTVDGHIRSEINED